MQQQVEIKSRKIGPGCPVYIIAEMACAHDGDLNKALKLIDAAVAAGADAVQLQFFRSDETVVPAHEVYGVLQKIEFTEDQWKTIIAHARKSDIAVMICTFDLPSVHAATSSGADAIKLNSADLSNPEVVGAVAKSGLPFTLGTGASYDEEIMSGLDMAAANGATQVILMHGVQNFPTKTEDLNIRRVKYLQEKFNIPVGYHDHTDGSDSFAPIVDLIAIGIGAHVIEKHITIDRSEKGIDYQASLEPEEFKEFVATIRRAETALGFALKTSLTESDLRYRKFQKKSIVAARKIEAGELITRNDVKFIRNTTPGLPPSDMALIEGRRALIEIELYQNIQQEHVAIK
ncbi:MAG TPA: N-acetylneuraminate synthase family protein [Bacteroidia bacterium]|nr:N-acetylneuraminate synthase family protein [Bacteroidia bacterium]